MPASIYHLPIRIINNNNSLLSFSVLYSVRFSSHLCHGTSNIKKYTNTHTRTQCPNIFVHSLRLYGCIRIIFIRYGFVVFHPLFIRNILFGVLVVAALTLYTLCPAPALYASPNKYETRTINRNNWCSRSIHWNWVNYKFNVRYWKFAWTSSVHFLES